MRQIQAFRFKMQATVPDGDIPSTVPYTASWMQGFQEGKG